MAHAACNEHRAVCSPCYPEARGTRPPIKGTGGSSSPGGGPLSRSVSTHCCCRGPPPDILKPLKRQTGVLPEGCERPTAPQQPSQGTLSLSCAARPHGSPVALGPRLRKDIDEPVNVRGALTPAAKRKTTYGTMCAQLVLHRARFVSRGPAKHPVELAGFAGVLLRKRPCTARRCLAALVADRIGACAVMQRLELERRSRSGPSSGTVNTKSGIMPCRFRVGMRAARALPS